MWEMIKKRRRVHNNTRQTHVCVTLSLSPSLKISLSRNTPFYHSFFHSIPFLYLSLFLCLSLYSYQFLLLSLFLSFWLYPPLSLNSEQPVRRWDFAWLGWVWPLVGVPLADKKVQQQQPVARASEQQLRKDTLKN